MYKIYNCKIIPRYQYGPGLMNEFGIKLTRKVSCPMIVQESWKKYPVLNLLTIIFAIKPKIISLNSLIK